ncbi:MAG: hypothetical protein JOY59_06935, partial [Candidatus Eremiobacteraeota bacterium]|nr:hypothetical protein [Candidatus Eremiobacteraeota bacterium]
LGLDGYRTTGPFHISPLVPPEFGWVAAVRVYWGGRLCTYVVDTRRRVIYGDMREAAADEPYRMVFAGRDVSDEISTSPVEVAAIAFEDDAGAVRMFLGNWDDRPRNVAVEFRGETFRRKLDRGELCEVTVGRPLLVDATPVKAVPGLESAPV